MAAVGSNAPPDIVRLLDEASRLAEASRAFASVERRESMVHCTAATNPDAAFRIAAEADGRLFVCWVSPDRYLSQSIEADLMWTGDDLNDLIDEELADQGYRAGPLGRVEHFRDPEKMFTFRSLIPAPADARALAACLLAYNAAFSRLGDMKESDDEE